MAIAQNLEETGRKGSGDSALQPTYLSRSVEEIHKNYFGLMEKEKPRASGGEAVTASKGHVRPSPIK